MYCRISQLTGLPIISLQSGEAIAWTRTPIFETTSLEIVAFKCEVTAHRHSLVLMTPDIRQVATDCLVIDSEDELTDPPDVVRLQPLIATGYSPVGKTVITDLGQKLGSVEDCTVNLESFRVQKLHVRRPVLRAWIGNGLVIDRSQIVDVTPARITVRDALVKNPMLGADPLPEIQP